MRPFPSRRRISGAIGFFFFALVSQNARAQNNAAPHLDQPLVPASAAPAGSAFTLKVNGTGFVKTSTVDWNGSPRTTTYVSGTQLTASIKASDIAVAGTASVTVVNGTPGGGTSNVVFFQVMKATTQVSLTGTNLAAGSSPAAVVTAKLNADGYQDLAV